MGIFKSEISKEAAAEIVEYLRIRGLQMGLPTHPIFRANRAKRECAEALEFALRTVADEIETSLIREAQS